MLKTLSLILPVMLPSWRFFKTIDPSPRVQWALYGESGAIPKDWQEFRPRPLTIKPLQMLARLFWNSDWNEALFVVSCAERIVAGPTPHSIHEITRRILCDINKMKIDTTDKTLQFRLVFVSRDNTGLSQEILFQSNPVPVTSVVI